tara:strand:- start:57 stop:368 length:312 start_codon:yes stop_codon:yes gene_type:complete
MELYTTEKNKFSSLQSSFDRLLNNIRKYDHIDKETEVSLLEINDMLDKLTYSVEELNDMPSSISKNKNENENVQLKIKNIDNDNKVIRDLIPLAIMYRMTLYP